MPVPADHARSSRRRYRVFVEDYRHGRLDATAAVGGRAHGRRCGQRADGTSGTTSGGLRLIATAIAGLLALAFVAAGLQMLEPLFMRFIVDRVLLNPGAGRVGAIDPPAHGRGLVPFGDPDLEPDRRARDYRQRQLNVHVMVSLRRSLFDRLLHLPLPRLWDMKTGGILSRLTGDVDTTTGLLQMALVTPSVSIVRLIIALGVLFSLNWRLALTALAIVPGVMVISFISARRVRPIYRSLRKDAEQIDGRVGETFSGIRIVRAFRREARELLEYMRGRHTRRPQGTVRPSARDGAVDDRGASCSAQSTS